MMPRILEHYDPPTIPWLDELYADENMVALNKQSGLLSVPGKKESHSDCIASRAKDTYGRVFPVHRLDMDTSGIILLARTKAALTELSRQFEKRQVQKTYIARLDGLVAEDEGTIDLPLICDWPNRPLQKVDHDMGKEAITHYQVLEREEAGITRVAFHPLTGRSHQLRVHAKSMGHVILGDRMYADAPAQEKAPRLQLHAERLSIILPGDTEPTEFVSPSPF